MHRKLSVVAAVCVVAMTTRAGAQERMPSFCSIPIGAGNSNPPTAAVWTEDRTAPNGFGSEALFEGRADVLKIDILGSSPSGTAGSGTSGGSNFYALQGREYGIYAPGPWTLSADLWVESGWASAAYGERRAELWGVSMNTEGEGGFLPAIGFTNEGSGTGRFRWATGSWTETWYDLAATVNYGAWNSLQLQFDPITSLFSYYVNGTFQTSVTSNGPAPSVYPAGGGTSAGLLSTIMQTYNYGQDYSVRWSSTSCSVPEPSNPVPEPSTFVLMAAGLALLGAGARRKQQATRV